VLAQISQIKEAIDASQQVRLRDVVIEVERVKELVLSAIQSTHHDDSLPSFDVFQDTQHSASPPTFSTQSTHKGRSHKNCRWPFALSKQTNAAALNDGLLTDGPHQVGQVGPGSS
jgi:hypothetical protein